MRTLQKGDTLSIVIYDWHNLIYACVDSSGIPTVEIKFSRLVIEDNKMKIEGAGDSGFIYASLLKISNARWFVDEIIY